MVAKGEHNASDASLPTKVFPLNGRLGGPQIRSGASEEEQGLMQHD
jgi:hypothetical protein